MPPIKNIIRFITYVTFSSVIIACGGGSNSSTQLDIVKPIIKLLGNHKITIIQGTLFKDPGATATDNRDGALPVSTSGKVDTSIIGINILSYIATDSSGNTAIAKREVNVISSQKNNAPTASKIMIKGSHKTGETLTLSYLYKDKENDPEGESIIIWSTPNQELQRSSSKSYTIHNHLGGETIKATLYPVDNKNKKGSPVEVVTPTINAVSIKKYGAVGDGVTDDTNALKTAFANETLLIIPKGTYLTKDSIVIPSTLQVISGVGTLKGTHPKGILSMSSAGTNKLHIEGITFLFEPTLDTKYGSLYFNDATIKNITIKNCHFVAPNMAKWGNAILLVGKQGQRLDNIKIIKNSFSNITRAAIEVLVRGSNTTKSEEFPDWPVANFIDTTVTNIIISDNTFTNENIYQAMGEEIFNPAISLSGAVNGTLIDNNTINGYYWGIELDGSVNQKITNNKINSKQNIFSITHGADPTGKTLIENNILSSPQHRILADTAKNITFRKNTITGIMYLWHVDNIIVDNNKFYTDTHFTNIMIRESKNCLIKNNYVENTYHTSRDGIRGHMGSDSSNIVSNNRIYVKATGGVATTYTDGIATSNNNSSVTFENNQSLAEPE